MAHSDIGYQAVAPSKKMTLASPATGNGCTSATRANWLWCPAQPQWACHLTRSMSTMALLSPRMRTCRLFTACYVRLPLLALNADLPFMCVFDCSPNTGTAWLRIRGMTSSVDAFPCCAPRGWSGVAPRAASLSVPAAVRACCAGGLGVTIGSLACV